GAPDRARSSTAGSAHPDGAGVSPARGGAGRCGDAGGRRGSSRCRARLARLGPAASFGRGLDRGARARSAPPRFPGGEEGGSRCRGVRLFHLGKRPLGVRLLRRGRRRPAHRRGDGPRVPVDGGRGDRSCRRGRRFRGARRRGPGMTPSAGGTSWQTCPRCHRDLDLSFAGSACPACGDLLDVRHRPPGSSGVALRELFAGRRGAEGELDRSGVWRFREVVLPDAKAGEVVSHPEGNTPLLRRGSVEQWTGIGGLLLKHEGHNPTGSFKDRGMTVGVTVAKRIGARAVACASTGNTSASLAAYGAQAGIPALVLVPAGNVALGKLAQSLAYGAT